MSTLRFVVVISVIFGLLFPVLVFEGLASSGEEAAASAIIQAEDVIVAAYGAVLEAEQTGIDDSDLVARLNDAVGLLAKAQVAFRIGDFDEAVLLAHNCSRIGEGVRSEADRLLVDAHGVRVMNSWLTMMGSLAGVGVVACGSFWGWRVFRRRYCRRVLKMKPEVAKDES